jgi:ATPase family associated with various cellular activities (AAA)/Winged helix domain, variant
MNADDANNWAEANQRYLMARVAMVREALRRHVARAQDDPLPPEIDVEKNLREAAEAMPAPAALDTLCAAFGLSPFERDVLLLCAGMELDSTFPSLCAAAQGQQQRALPTFSLALAALPEAHWSALTPVAPLRHWRLIEVGVGEALTASPLRIDERALHYLAGLSYLDERLQGLLDLQPPPEDLPSSQRALAERIAGIWAQSGPGGLPVIHLGGDDGAGKRAVAALACAELGMQLRTLRAADAPLNATEREALSRLWEREATLNRSALLVECDDVEKERAALSFLDHTRGFLLAASREPLRLRRRLVTRLEVKKPDAAEQRRLWQASLGPLATQLDGRLETMISQFDLGMEEISDACASLSRGEDGRSRMEDRVLRVEEGDSQSSILDLPSSTLDRLWDACRLSARARLDDLAQRIESVADWDDLVLPAFQLQTLRDIAAQSRQRTRVYHSWGFASKGERGLGISALFAGVSGTGKTMAAEVLARELRLDLYRIDLSQVVSKYIGETEKNLRRVFDAAEAGGAVLLFDEADALFGKRSEVKDSHDRYANIEISYLLQRMETYRGLAILTTNMKSVLDVSFLRRLRFVVQFPFPDAELRAEIWRRVFPARTPVENLDVNKLARLNVAGGNIRNIALSAAFLAAEAGEPVRMRHLLRAARGEYAKVDKQLTESEVRDWL